MGLFSKKEKHIELPILPELPKLPTSPNFLSEEDFDEKEKIHELPSFPTNPLGEKFSQDTIKNAIQGKEDFFEIPKPLISKPDFISPLEEEIVSSSKSIKSSPREEFQKNPYKNYSSKEGEPVFIRIDKFEETIKIIRDTKKKIEEIENLLEETKELKKKEEEELSLWEKEIQEMKQQIEKIDRDIFSRI